jgi:hypothetical protein
VRDGQKTLILFICAAIDSGKNSSITVNDIVKAVNNETIFSFMQNEIDSPYPLPSNLFSESDQDHLVAHWQLLLNSTSFAENFRIEKQALCILLALVTLSIQ